jgi:hypothetical protein
MDGSEADQVSVTRPWPTLAAPKAGASGVGVFVMTKARSPMVETLPDGSNATNFSVVSCAMSMGAVKWVAFSASTSPRTGSVPSVVK